MTEQETDFEPSQPQSHAIIASANVSCFANVRENDIPTQIYPLDWLGRQDEMLISKEKWPISLWELGQWPVNILEASLLSLGGWFFVSVKNHTAFTKTESVTRLFTRNWSHFAYDFQLKDMWVQNMVYFIFGGRPTKYYISFLQSKLKKAPCHANHLLLYCPDSSHRRESLYCKQHFLFEFFS